MEHGSGITYLRNSQIDKAKWDACITNASNGLIYGYSYYLDHMAKNWDGLVLNDYEAVMPLTWNRKYGVAYLYQPFLCAQLGVFGTGISEEVTQRFLWAIPSKFLYWDIYLNHQNMHSVPKVNVYERRNFVLNLGASYESLYGGYRENIQRNIKKAGSMGCLSVKGFEAKQVLTLAAEQMKGFGKGSSEEDMERFGRLYEFLAARDQATTYGIRSAAGELISSCIFTRSHNRAYYILVGNHADGRTVGASHALIDAFIRDHAGQELLLDFEGSDIRNLAFFYSSFGAREEKYAAVKMNKLPFYLKWLKD